MSREDFEVFDLIKKERKEKRAARREEFKGGPGWTQLSETHWRYVLNGRKLDYWPGPMKWQWQGKIATGSVYDFIKRREKGGAVQDLQKGDGAETPA